MCGCNGMPAPTQASMDSTAQSLGSALSGAVAALGSLVAEVAAERKTCGPWTNKPPNSTAIDPFNKYKTCCVHRTGKSGHGVGACLVISKPDNSSALPVPDYQGNYGAGMGGGPSWPPIG